jgi:UDP-2-acetamido-3-amino-2,3-dideoxy-glucuronate N-acetyltransferase
MGNSYIHPTAHVSSDSQIGEGTKVWINVQIREGSEIGTDCIISKDVYIDHAVRIGDRCKIQNSVSVYSGVTIEDDVFVGPNVSFTNDKVPRAFNTEWKITPTVVRKGASIGANATIVCGVEVGEYAMIAAGAVVSKTVPNHALVLGNPAKIVAYVCRCGQRLSDNGYCKLCNSMTELPILGDKN